MESFLRNSSVNKHRSFRGKDLEPGSQMNTLNSDYGMEDFFKQLKEVEEFMEQLTKDLKKLQEANEESKSVTKTSAMRTIKKRMDREISDIGKAVCAIKMKLEEVDRENVENQKKPGCEKGTAVDRSRISMTIPLKKKLKDSMNDFQKLRQSMQNEYREVVKKRVFTVTGTAPTEEMIDELIETGDSEKIFQKAIVGENGRGQVIDAMEEIQERNGAIKEIEKKMLELQQVFVDMEMLVKAQGELLDNIESQVAIAINHIENGVDALETTKSMENKSRKCMMIVICVLVIFVSMVALTILKPWK